MKDIYCLSNLIDNSNAINEPLQHSNRIKYSSFDASQNYYVFGATSGSLYLFSRRVCKFLHLIPNKHGPVTHVAISPHEKYVAFSTLKGTICVYVINLSANSAPQVMSCGIGADNQVNCIHWSQEEKQFYYGDRKGQVNLVLLNSFMGRSLLNLSVHPILFLDSPIVQIDDFESLLLVSNYTKCILCNTEYEEYKQIGNRPRDGEFGACFLISPHEQIAPSRIYCARPGSRLWEVDFEGNVLQTHQFKASLACPPTKIEKSCTDLSTILKYEENEEIIDFQPQTLMFGHLQAILSDFIVSYTDTGLYVFDIRTSNVVLWCNQFERIANCRVIGDEISVFTQSGMLLTVRLQAMHRYALTLVREERLLDCSALLKRNVRYFADKAKDDYDLIALNHIKNFLIDQNMYEILNDLSVIFDSIAQNENDISSGSSGERRNDPLQNNFEQQPNGVYVLENSFCDNLRAKTVERDNQFKDALLTVTGKFGKNIIKYKFNIFSDEQKSLVSDLIPSNERAIPFKDINERFENDEEIVAKKVISPRKPPSQQRPVISEEEKTIYNLFLIFRSSQISNTNFLDRYRVMFDKYTSREIINILAKLEIVMVENGDSATQAKKNCYEMYFNYLKPELIWEVDDVSRKFIIEGFVLLNTSRDIVRCDNCDFPIRFDCSCRFHELGEILFKYLWSRSEHEKCFDILTDVPALFDVLCRFYAAEGQIEKILPIVLNLSKPSLLEEMGKHFDFATWDRCFEMFVALQKGHVACINCVTVTVVENVCRHFFYTWNCFLNIALKFLKPCEILTLVFKYSNLIPNDAIDREFYTKCILQAF